MALSLPEDILIIIIELSDKSTLRSLLFVSKQIHHFAEPIFLKAVSLDVSGRPSTLSLFRTFIRSTPLSLGSLKNQGHSQLQARRPRSLCVKSFSVKFVALHDREDIEVLDKLLPTLINLESLSFNFHFYNTEIGRFAFLQDAPVDASLSNYSSPMSLREFSFTSSGHQGTLDIAPFLRSRPNLERIHLYSTLVFVPPQQKLSFPNLKVYGGYVPLQTLLRSTETLTHARALLQTEGLPEMPALLTWSVDSLQDLTFTTLNFILLRARNVKYLEIFDFDFGWDYWEDLGDALCDSNVEYIRIVIDSDSSWNTTRVRSIFSSQPNGRLGCIEIQRPAEGHWYEHKSNQSPASGQPTSTRWYRDQDDAVVVGWECKAEEVWLLDWEQDFSTIQCSQSDRRISQFD